MANEKEPDLKRDSLSAKLVQYFSPKSPDCVWPRALPAVGCVSYTAFALHVYHPRGLARLFPGSYLPIANCLLINSHIGAGLYIYNRPHIRTLPPLPRVIFSAYGSILFNFGSILLWAYSKPLFSNPDTPSWFRSLIATTAAIGLIYVGYEYLNYVDSLD